MRAYPHCLLLCLLFCVARLAAAEAPLNTLTAAEKKAGWKLLFNGQSLDGWRNFKKPTAPDHGWTVTNGVLTCVAGGKGGDIITTEKFDDFELTWEWSMPPKSNNGVKYFIFEERGQAIGHEYQMIDDTLEKETRFMTASFYEVLSPHDVKVKPWGEWNHSRILVRGNHVEHWLNGTKVLEYECGSDEVKAGVARSKFKNVEGFGNKVRGHILLTYHNDEASFRNLKLREFGAAK
jgi:hypothetical protein